MTCLYAYVVRLVFGSKKHDTCHDVRDFNKKWNESRPITTRTITVINELNKYLDSFHVSVI